MVTPLSTWYLDLYCTLTAPADVWICTGQSNMWLPMSHTFQRQASVRVTDQPQLAFDHLCTNPACTHHTLNLDTSDSLLACRFQLPGMGCTVT